MGLEKNTQIDNGKEISLEAPFRHELLYGSLHLVFLGFEHDHTESATQTPTVHREMQQADSVLFEYFSHDMDTFFQDQTDDVIFNSLKRRLGLKEAIPHPSKHASAYFDHMAQIAAITNLDILVADPARTNAFVQFYAFTMFAQPTLGVSIGSKISSKIGEKVAVLESEESTSEISRRRFLKLLGKMTLLGGLSNFLPMITTNIENLQDKGNYNNFPNTQALRRAVVARAIANIEKTTRDSSRPSKKHKLLIMYPEAHCRGIINFMVNSHRAKDVYFNYLNIISKAVGGSANEELCSIRQYRHFSEDYSDVQAWQMVSRTQIK